MNDRPHPSNVNESVKIGTWVLTPGIRTLSGAQGKYALSKSSSRLLLLLFQRAGEVVTKEELLTKVWPDVLVSEDSLTKSVSELRKILSNDPSGSVQIDTIRGVGYQLNQNEDSTKKPRRLVFLAGAAAILTLLAVVSVQLWGDKDSGDINLTNNSGEQRGPRISPDGTKVLYSSISEGWNDFDIHFQTIGQSESVKLTSANVPEMDPIWSPDGESVVYIRYKDNQKSIVSRALDSGEEKVISALRSSSGLSILDWSEKTGKIVFSDKNDEDELAIFEIDPADENSRRQLTNPSSSIMGDHAPKASPDGNSIAFIRITESFPLYKHLIPGSGEVFIKSGNELKQLTNLKSVVSGVSWVDDDNLLFSAVHDFYDFRVYRLNIKTGEKEVIYETDQLIRNLDFNRSSRTLAFESWDLNYKIWKVWSNEKDVFMADALFTEDGREWCPAISPSGNELAYMRDSGNGAKLVIQDLKELLKAPSKIDSGMINNVSWSADGSILLYEKLTSDSSYVFTYDRHSQESTLRFVTTGGYKFPFWSNDNAAIYFSPNQQEKTGLIKYNLASGTKEPVIVDANISRGQVSGDNLLFARTGVDGLWSNDQSLKPVLPDLHPHDGLNWSLTNGQVFFIARDPFFQSALSSYDLQTGQKRTLFNLPKSVAVDFAGLTIDVERESYFVSLNTKKRSDIILLKGL